MNANRWWVLGGTLVALIVVAAGWLVAIQPALSAAATSDTTATSARAQNDAIALKLASLSKVAAKRAALEQQDATLQKAMPGILTPNLLSRRFFDVAAANNVTVSSWSLGAGAKYTVPAGLAAAAAPAPAVTPGATPAASAPAAPVATGSTAPKLAKTSPLITPANLTVVPIAMTIMGAQSDVLRFATAIQNDERVILVTGFVMQHNDDGTTSGALTGSTYVLQR